MISWLKILANKSASLTLIIVLTTSCADFLQKENSSSRHPHAKSSTKLKNNRQKQQSVNQSESLNSADSALKPDQVKDQATTNLSSENLSFPVVTPNQKTEARKLFSSENTKIEIALLIPVSGKNKELGDSLFNAATLSIFENDLDNQIKLVVFDSKDDSKSTEQAFQKIIERKIRYVIGPVFSTAIPIIEKTAQANQVVVISLSNNHEMLGKVNENGGVFLGGILPESQLDKIVNYSIDKGKQNFSIIAPNSHYGKTITEYLKAFVRSRNANFITSEFYGSIGNDIDRVAERAINSFMIPESLKMASRKEKSISEADRSYADVILIPESGRILSKIVAAIKKQNNNERPLQIIGSSQWDEISTLNDSNLIGAWFPAPGGEEFRNFEKRFYANFGKYPPRISSIAYDGVNAVIAALRKNQYQQATVKNFINFSENGNLGFAGIDGRFRLLPNGAIQRNLSVLRVENGKFKEIDSSAEGFLRY